jgi:hypothetical protein
VKSGSVKEVQVYLDANATTATKVAAGIYADNNGHAGTLVAQGTLNTVKPDAWNAISIPAASVTADQSYWIATTGLDGQIGFLDQLSTGASVKERTSTKVR